MHRYLVTCAILLAGLLCSTTARAVLVQTGNWCFTNAPTYTAVWTSSNPPAFVGPVGASATTTIQNEVAKDDFVLPLALEAHPPTGYQLKSWYATNLSIYNFKAKQLTQFDNSYTITRLSVSDFDDVAISGGNFYLLPYFDWLTYTLQYANTYNSTLASVNKSYIDSVTLAVPSDKARDGYTFTGWGKTANSAEWCKDGKSQTIARAGEVFGATIDGPVTLYANWKANTYAVKFDSNAPAGEISGSMANQSFTYDVAQNLNKNNFSRNDGSFTYSFGGWTNATYKTPIKDGASVLNLATSGTVTLYAVWNKVKKYSITFDCAINGKENDFKNIASTKKVMLPGCETSKPGYTFTGWLWQYDTGVAEVLESGKEFSWDNILKHDNSPGDHVEITFNARWSPIEYTLSLHENGGLGRTNNVDLDYDDTYKLTNVFPRVGYTLTQWTENADGSGTSYAVEAEVSSLLSASGIYNLHAQWTTNRYTIVFNASGAAGSMGDVSDRLYDQIFNLPSNAFEKVGYTFEGWATNENGTVIFEDGVAVSNLTAIADVSVNLFAVWSANQYTIKFDPNGGSGTMDGMTGCKYDTKYQLSSNKFTCNGYNFEGWSTNENKTVDFKDGATVSNLTAVAGGEVTLTAVWGALSYEIHFDTMGGDMNLDSTNVVHGTTLVLPTTAGSKSGYKLSGWSTTKDGAVVFKSTISINQEFLNSLDETKTLYAVWELADGDLRDALDLDPDTSFVLVNKSNWAVTSQTSDVLPDKDESYLTAATVETLEMIVYTNGTLTFSWQMRENEELWVSDYKLILNYASGGVTNQVKQWKGQKTEAWQEFSVAVTNASPEKPVCLQWKYDPNMKNATAFLDNFVWTPAGASVKPTEENIPELVLQTTDGSLELSFEYDKRFQYKLWTTSTLSPPDWKLSGIEGTVKDDKMIFDGLIKEGEPSMFYKVEVLQK